MTLDESIRYGMVALGGATLVLTAMGLHVGPIDASNIVSGACEL